MKMVLLVLTAGMLLLSMSGCQCGCMNSAVSQDGQITAANRQPQNPSYPAISSEIEFRAEYAKSF